MKTAKIEPLIVVETKYILKALTAFKGNVVRTADALKINYATLVKRMNNMKKAGITLPKKERLPTSRAKSLPKSKQLAQFKEYFTNASN